MGERDRVRAAIQGPVDHADKLLEGLQGSDVETRLRVVIDGWGRGLAAGLEELALALQELRERRGEEVPEVPVPEPRAGAPEIETSESGDVAEAREQVAAQREEAEQARRELD